MAVIAGEAISWYLAGYLRLQCNGTRDRGPLARLSFRGRMAGSDAGGKDIAIGPGQCSTEQACKSGLCYQPGQSIGCGMCKPGESTCQDDSKCALEDICRPVVCSCEGALACQPGCKTASDCAEGQTCAGDFHCTSLVCKPGDASCPADFACVMPTSGNPGCMRKTCSASSECQGVCVKGECFSQPGTCNFPPP
jgi:hypothetical protein